MKVMFLGAPVDAPPAHLTTEQKLDATGKNTGNMLIGQALKRQLRLTHYEQYKAGMSPDWIVGNFDLIAIPASNFLFRNFDFGAWAEILEEIELPCLMVGLGAQAPTTADAEIEVPAGTKRFLAIVADRSKSIGVRGDYTAEVMHRLGFHNVRSLGCPSLYWNLRPTIDIQKRSSYDLRMVSINGSRNVISHMGDREQGRMVEASLLRIARERNYPYVLQNELPELHACVDCRELTAEHREQLHHISNTLQLGWSAEEYFHFIRDSCKVFFDVFEWSEYIKRVDFSVGTRFHGNLIALLHGVPAVIIAHDSRTLEMCELMKIPHLSLAEIERVDVSDVYDWADFAPFCSAYEELYCSYVDFLEENGIAHVLRPSSPVQAEKSPEDST